MSKFENYILAPIVAVIMLIVVIIMFSPIIWLLPIALFFIGRSYVLEWLSKKKNK